MDYQGITKCFTTINFAEAIGQYGLNVPYQFYYHILGYDYGLYAMYMSGEQIGNLRNGTLIGIVKAEGDKIQKHKAGDYIPAYPLMEVLKWLPEFIYKKGISFQLNVTIEKGNVLAGYAVSFIDAAVVGGFRTVESLILLGLEENWLNESIILQAIEDAIKENQP